MILTSHRIKDLIENEQLITPYILENIQSTSYDVTISNVITKIRPMNDVIDLESKELVTGMYEVIQVDDFYILAPNESILVTLNEKIKIPTNLFGEIRPRTSLERAFLTINHQHINPGYSGVLQLRLTNLSGNYCKIRSNSSIGQLLLYELVYQEEYDDYKGNKYQNETGREGSKIYQDFEKKTN